MDGIPTSTPAPAAPIRIPCPSCKRPVELSIDGDYRCPWPRCGRRFRAFVFAGAVERAPGAAPEPIDPGTAPCAAHPGNRAEGVCSRCGAFACRLCLVELGNRTFCARCFSRLHGAGEIDRTRRGRMRWESLGLILGIASLFPLWGLPLAFAAGVVFAVGLRARRRQPDAIQSMPKLVIGFVLAILSIAIHIASIAGMVAMGSRLRRTRGPNRR
ncbi:MAG: hypothetical protein JXP34_20745 [Planctomycetes bacterium]|nr:hypothetical protein [Planctomycetota bacterium]